MSERGGADRNSPELAREALGLVLKSKTFSSSPNLGRLLRICVDQTLLGTKLKQEEIARAMDYRGFSPLEDSKVRRELGRLRQKLRDYYDEEGACDPLVISIPKAIRRDGYGVCFRARRGPADEESQNPRYLRLVSEARRYWVQRTPAGFAEALRLCEEAIQEDPDHSASAQVSLAECYFFMAIWGFPPHKTMPKARECANKALSLRPNDAAAHAVLGFVTSVYDWNWSRGGDLLEKAVELSPHSVDVRCCYSNHLVCVGSFAEAACQARRAQALEHEPSAVILSHVGKILYVCGELDAARDLLKLSLEINPRFYFNHWHLGLVLLARAETEPAMDHLREAAALAPESSGVLASLGYAEGVLGHRDCALQCLQSLTEMRGSRYVPSTDFAMLHAGLGDADAAFETLNRAFAEKCLYLVWLHA